MEYYQQVVICLVKGSPQVFELRQPLEQLTPLSYVHNELHISLSLHQFHVPPL